MKSLASIFIESFDGEGCTPSSQSWAWIDPGGEFYRVRSHEQWAYDYLKEKGELELVWKSISKEQRLADMYNGVGFQPAPGNGYRLRPNEYGLLRVPYDEFVTLEKAFLSGEKDQPANTNEMAWRIIYGQRVELWRGSVNYLLEKGWMRAVNPFAVTVYDGGTYAQWWTLFYRGAKCWKGSFEYGFVVGGRGKAVRGSWVEEVYKNLSRKNAEVIVGIVNERT